MAKITIFLHPHFEGKLIVKDTYTGLTIHTGTQKEIDEFLHEKLASTIQVKGSVVYE